MRKIYNFQKFNENISFNDISEYLIEGRYLFHYTLTEHLEEILTDGLIPRKNPNSYYQGGSKGVFLTTSRSLYNANLPQDLMDLMDAYYDDGESYDKPIVRLWIDISNLNLKKFALDDDYVLNKYDWNEAESDKEKLIESLKLWGSLSYEDTISPNIIKKYDYEYLS